MPSLGALLPGRHSLGCAAPPGQKKPIVHGMQSFLLVKLPGAYVPGSQAAGNGTDAPRGQRNPSGHGKQLAPPSAGWYVSALHAAQSVLRSPTAKLPALQLVGTVEPATQKVPDGHGRHSERSARLV